MKSRILVVDDNVNLTTLLGKTLEKFGYEVGVENDSEFAIDTVRRFQPNLIILDVMMPHRDGGEVLRDLRADLALRPIPVILLTGLAREAQGLANQGGIRSVVLSKPIELKLLLHEIDSHINESMTFSERMNDRVERQTSQPVHLRGGNAFGGPDPELMRKKTQPSLPELPGQRQMPPFQRLMSRNRKKEDVGMSR